MSQSAATLTAFKPPSALEPFPAQNSQSRSEDTRHSSQRRSETRNSDPNPPEEEPNPAEANLDRTRNGAEPRNLAEKLDNLGLSKKKEDKLAKKMPNIKVFSGEPNERLFDR